MTRADALRALISDVEATETLHDRFLWPASPTHEFDARLYWAGDVRRSAEGSLDAVARLEAPLRERGWWLRVLHTVGGVDAFQKLFGVYDTQTVMARAPTEPRARLLAVLKAMLHEAEAANA